MADLPPSFDASHVPKLFEIASSALLGDPGACATLESAESVKGYHALCLAAIASTCVGAANVDANLRLFIATSLRAATTRAWTARGLTDSVRADKIETQKELLRASLRADETRVTNVLRATLVSAIAGKAGDWPIARAALSDIAGDVAGALGAARSASSRSAAAEALAHVVRGLRVWDAVLKALGARRLKRDERAFYALAGESLGAAASICTASMAFATEAVTEFVSERWTDPTWADFDRVVLERDGAVDQRQRVDAACRFAAAAARVRALENGGFLGISCDAARLAGRVGVRLLAAGSSDAVTSPAGSAIWCTLVRGGVALSTAARALGVLDAQCDERGRVMDGVPGGIAAAANVLAIDGSVSADEGEACGLPWPLSAQKCLSRTLRGVTSVLSSSPLSVAASSSDALRALTIWSMDVVLPSAHQAGVNAGLSTRAAAVGALFGTSQVPPASSAELLSRVNRHDVMAPPQHKAALEAALCALSIIIENGARVEEAAASPSSDARVAVAAVSEPGAPPGVASVGAALLIELRATALRARGALTLTDLIRMVAHGLLPLSPAEVANWARDPTGEAAAADSDDGGSTGVRRAAESLALAMATGFDGGVASTRAAFEISDAAELAFANAIVASASVSSAETANAAAVATRNAALLAEGSWTVCGLLAPDAIARSTLTPPRFCRLVSTRLLPFLAASGVPLRAALVLEAQTDRRAAGLVNSVPDTPPDGSVAASTNDVIAALIARRILWFVSCARAALAGDGADVPRAVLLRSSLAAASARGVAALVVRSPALSLARGLLHDTPRGDPSLSAPLVLLAASAVEAAADDAGDVEDGETSARAARLAHATLLRAPAANRAAALTPLATPLPALWAAARRAGGRGAPARAAVLDLVTSIARAVSVCTAEATASAALADIVSTISGDSLATIAERDAATLLAALAPLVSDAIGAREADETRIPALRLLAAIVEAAPPRASASMVLVTAFAGAVNAAAIGARGAPELARDAARAIALWMQWDTGGTAGGAQPGLATAAAIRPPWDAICHFFADAITGAPPGDIELVAAACDVLVDVAPATASAAIGAVIARAAVGVALGHAVAARKVGAITAARDAIAIALRGAHSKRRHDESHGSDESVMHAGAGRRTGFGAERSYLSPRDDDPALMNAPQWRAPAELAPTAAGSAPPTPVDLPDAARALLLLCARAIVANPTGFSIALRDVATAWPSAAVSAGLFPHCSLTSNLEVIGDVSTASAQARAVLCDAEMWPAGATSPTALTPLIALAFILATWDSLVALAASTLSPDAAEAPSTRAILDANLCCLGATRLLPVARAALGEAAMRSELRTILHKGATQKAPPLQRDLYDISVSRAVEALSGESARVTELVTVASVVSGAVGAVRSDAAALAAAHAARFSTLLRQPAALGDGEDGGGCADFTCAYDADSDSLTGTAGEHTEGDSFGAAAPTPEWAAAGQRAPEVFVDLCAALRDMLSLLRTQLGEERWPKVEAAVPAAMRGQLIA